ncbi:unnamed protein product [Dicrocoelium dendriticum]|nr:unnamed protein product [Dicrocoelium dendriticum]
MSDSNEVHTQPIEDCMIAAIDQGTSSSRVCIFSTFNGQVIASHQVRVTPTYPASGWLELDADELYETTLECLNQCAKQLIEGGRKIGQLMGIGVTNQRETTIVWDRKSGKPLAPAIVWSDARTTELAKKYVELTPGKTVNAFQHKTGLPIHSYFTALKLCWLLENVPAVSEAHNNGTLLAGTVDTWLIWRLTNGTSHVTDVTNASRTLLFNIHTLTWDPDLCRFFDIDAQILPQVKASAEVVGIVSDPRCNLKDMRICGILGDQQASLVAQTWDLSVGVSFEPTVKVTYGTGAFMLWDIGETPYFSDRGILTTVAFQMGSRKKAHYALEGSVSFAGATLDWLKKALKIFSNYDEAETLAQTSYRKHKQAMAEPCYLVPAFSGLLCPWWQETARGTISGLTADVECGDLIYAALRSSVYQTYDVLSVVTPSQRDSKSDATLLRPREIVVDGGLASSSVLLQSLADILDMIVRKHNHSELMTALGAAVAAALAVGIEPSGLLKLRNYPYSAQQPVHTFASSISDHCRQVMLTGWHAAVERSLGWIEASSVIENIDSLQNLMSKMVKRKSDTTTLTELPVPVVCNSEPKGSELRLSVGKFLSLMGVCVIFGAVLTRLISTH